MLVDGKAFLDLMTNVSSEMKTAAEDGEVLET
jgi:hypothetical protein